MQNSHKHHMTNNDDDILSVIYLLNRYLPMLKFIFLTNFEAP